MINHQRKKYVLLGLLGELFPVPIQHMAGIRMGGEETNIVDLGPSFLLRSQKQGPAL